MRWLLAALFLAFCFGSVDADRAEECSKCKGLGRVPCKSHVALNVGGIRVGDFDCADCLDLACCHGVGWDPCPKCKDAKAQEEWKELFERKKGVFIQLAEVFEKKWMEAEKCRFVKERNARKKLHIFALVFQNLRVLRKR